MKEIAKLKQRQYKHIKSSPSRIKKDEEAAQNANKYLQKWNSVPWDTYLTILHSLESALLASEKLQEDFLTTKNRAMVKILSLAENKALDLEQLMQDQ